MFVYSSADPKTDPVPDFIEIDPANRLGGYAPLRFPPAETTSTSATFDIYCYIGGSATPPDHMTLYLINSGAQKTTKITASITQGAQLVTNDGTFKLTPTPPMAIIDASDRNDSFSFTVPRTVPSETTVLHFTVPTPPYLPGLVYSVAGVTDNVVETIVSNNQPHVFVTLPPYTGPASDGADYAIVVAVGAGAPPPPSGANIYYERGRNADGSGASGAPAIAATLLVVNTLLTDSRVPPPGLPAPVIQITLGDTIPIVLYGVTAIDAAISYCVIQKDLSNPAVADITDMTIVSVNPTPAKTAITKVMGGQLPLDFNNQGLQGPLAVYMVTVDAVGNVAMSPPSLLEVTFVPAANPMPDGSLPAPSLGTIEYIITSNTMQDATPVYAPVTPAQIQQLWPDATGVQFIILIDGYRQGAEKRDTITADVLFSALNNTDNVSAPIDYTTFAGYDTGPNNELGKVVVQYKVLSKNSSAPQPYSLARTYAIDTVAPHTRKPGAG
ncbi:hypothetical protein ACFOEX_08155 [Camelimonas abortus]|uniref:Uncharacterized protein n=1 Tax=Camelimonas abortus TaxID=1017184 RepID=A0ABV7LF87_9HYPH